LKSNVSDYLEIAQAIYIDACARCIADVSDLRDLKTIRSRVEKEGISFLTISLPRFCQDFERSLALGYIDPTLFQHFRKCGLGPSFLKGLIGRLFNYETGRIYGDENSISIDDHTVLVDCVRQICLAFKKIQLACTPKRIQAAIANFSTIEQSFPAFSVPEEELDYFRRVSSMLWDNIMANIRLDKLVPRHGPGATAERASGNRKYDWRIWHDRLEPFFPILDSAYSNSAIESEELKKVTVVKPEQEQPVRVVCVPKTLKGPRIIAIEPCCMQYAQQAIRRVLYDTIESSELTKGHVNFRDQSVNQRLALISSYDGQLATIDLSDASDRVPRDLALEMFRSNPDLRDAIDACRSTSAELPDGVVIRDLKKFASMGSALCFPIESMYFYTICVVAQLRERKLPVSHANIMKVSRGIHVYGDDLVVPVTYASVTLDYLQKYNCKVNVSKTFFSGNFRESCGTDAYEGEVVTPVYLRKQRPKSMREGSELLSWVATANAFYKRGYWHTAQLMYLIIERIIGPLPYVSERSQALGRTSYLGYRSVGRWNGKLHRFEVKAWFPVPVYRTDVLEGYAALQKSLLRLHGETPVEPSQLEIDQLRLRGYLPPPVEVDRLNLQRSALHGAVALQRRWVPSLV